MPDFKTQSEYRAMQDTHRVLMKKTIAELSTIERQVAEIKELFSVEFVWDKLHNPDKTSPMHLLYKHLVQINQLTNGSKKDLVFQIEMDKQ